MRLLKCLVFVFVALVFASAELEIPYSARRNYNFCKLIKGIFTVTQKALNDDTCMRQVRLQESKVCQRVRPMEKQKFCHGARTIWSNLYKQINRKLIPTDAMCNFGHKRRVGLNVVLAINGLFKHIENTLKVTPYIHAFEKAKKYRDSIKPKYPPKEEETILDDCTVCQTVVNVAKAVRLAWIKGDCKAHAKQKALQYCRAHAPQQYICNVVAKFWETLYRMVDLLLIPNDNFCPRECLYRGGAPRGSSGIPSQAAESEVLREFGIVDKRSVKTPCGLCKALVKPVRQRSDLSRQLPVLKVRLQRMCSALQKVNVISRKTCEPLERGINELREEYVAQRKPEEICAQMLKICPAGVLDKVIRFLDDLLG